MRLATILLAACTAVLMTGCGQKGPLRLPDKSAAVVTSPQTASAPAAAPATSTTTAPAEKSKEKSADSKPPQ